VKLIDINAEITGVAIVCTCFNEVCVGACMCRMLAPTSPHADSVAGFMSSAGKFGSDTVYWW
jgi:hypothetical protein